MLSAFLDTKWIANSYLVVSRSKSAEVIQPQYQKIKASMIIVHSSNKASVHIAAMEHATISDLKISLCTLEAIVMYIKRSSRSATVKPARIHVCANPVTFVIFLTHILLVGSKALPTCARSRSCSLESQRNVRMLILLKVSISFQLKQN